MIVFKYALLRSLRSPLSIVVSIFVPIAFIFLPVNTWKNTPVAGVANLVLLMLLSAHLLSGVILEDRIDGSVIRVLTSPVSTFSYIFQNLLSVIIPLIIQIILLGISGYRRYNWSIEYTLGISICMILFVIANTAFVFCWNMFFKSIESSKYTFWLFVAVIALLSGLVVPIEMLPSNLQHVGAILHPYWLMRSVNVLTDNGINIEFWLLQSILILFAVAFLFLGGKRRSI
jgi:ABC-2 type transport system permease protein